MGRWAQRSRGGGGLNPPNYILTASIDDATTALLVYKTAVTATGLGNTAFISLPSGTTSIAVLQNGAEGAEVDFIGDISADETIRFNGPAANVLSPQTVTYT